MEDGGINKINYPNGIPLQHYNAPCKIKVVGAIVGAFGVTGVGSGTVLPETESRYLSIYLSIQGHQGSSAR